MDINKHIENLRELNRVTCQDCEMRKAGVSCCRDPLSNYRKCDYIISLNYAIETLKVLQEAKKDKLIKLQKQWGIEYQKRINSIFKGDK